MPDLGKALKFRLERWIQRGALHQMIFVATLIAGIAVLGGLAGWILTDDFEGPGVAIWWSFLRLTDPGYLGDDNGVTLRIVSTVVTVLGYVLFMGSLIAIMTQWLSRTIRQLESGLTPISMHNHIVILGWTNRTPEIVVKLLNAKGRLSRFLNEIGERKLRIVVLADEVNAEVRHDLREQVGAAWSDNQVFLRSGSALEPEDLERLDLGRAAVVIVPGADFELGGAELTDTRVIKALLTLHKLLRPLPVEDRPLVVAEIFDPDKMNIAMTALDGHAEVVSSDAVISRLISQGVRRHRLIRAFLELLSHRVGNSLYVRRFPELAGSHPSALNARFPNAIVVGAIRKEAGKSVTYLVPSADFRLQSEDLLIFVAESHDRCRPTAEGELVLMPPRSEEAAPRELRPRQSILILGWSYKVGSILAELSASSTDRYQVTLVSRVAIDERERALGHVRHDEDRVRFVHLVEDYARRDVLDRLDATRFDTVVFLASTLMRTSEEADARTVLGYVMLRSIVPEGDLSPEILIELVDPANSRLFEEGQDEMLVSPRILSHLLAHVSLRPELNSVFNELFVTGGAEVELRPASQIGLAGRTVDFGTMEREALGRDEIALGLMLAKSANGRQVRLNPGADSSWTLAADDELIVLAPA